MSRSYTYDGLSRLKTAVGPWEKPTGATGAVTWTYSYDALGNLRGQASTRSPANLADVRSWSYGHATKPHFLSSFAQANQPTETLAATVGGEVATISRPSLATETLVWNALGKLRQHKNSTYSYDVFGELTQTVTGPSGSTSSIVSVGDDFEYDITALRSNKYFSIQGVRIASLATSYTAPTASVPPALRIVIRYAEPLAAPAAAALLALGLLSLASLTLRRRTPVWLSVSGVGVLSFTLVALPFTAQTATLTSGPGAYGRHGEPILAYLVDHLGTIRGAVNQTGVVVETRDYAPFGESIAHTGAFAVQHRFTGQPQDDQAGGLYHYGARFYNPKWGRFISPDEMVQGFDSQGLNPFTYVLNRPTSATDPTGTLILNGESFGARATDIFGNVTGEGRGPDSPGKGQVTVSGSNVSGDADITTGEFLLFGFLPGPSDPPAPPPVDGWKLPLDTINLLQTYFPEFDVSTIRIHEGLPWFVSEAFDGYTSGNDVYFKLGVYDPTSPSGVSVIAHEVKHSADEKALGTGRYRGRYLAEYVRNRLKGQSGDEAYRNISFEKDARDIQRQVLSDLAK